MVLEENIHKVIEAMAEDMAVIMKTVLTEKDPWYANSNLVKTLQTAVLEEGDNYIMELTANSYIYWLDKGRPPTQPDAVPSDFFIRLADWCSRRGIGNTNDVVYPIWKKIHKEGYEGKHFMEDFWDELDRKMEINLDTIFETICDYLSTEVFND